MLEYCEDADVIFVDIGGDRLADTVLLFLALLVERLASWRMIVVKSEELAARIDAALSEDLAMTPDGDLDGVAQWLSTQCQAAKEAITAAGPGMQTAISGCHSADSRGIVHPLKQPKRFTKEGVEICRYYNYQECLKRESGECDRDHDHCHCCGELGHRAVECSAFNVTGQK